MTYSVWNPATALYDYYETPVKAADARPPAPRLGGEPMGVAPDVAAWPLPGNARKVGAGPFARGMIASRTGLSGGLGLGFLPDFGNQLNLVVLLVGGFLAWKYLKK